MALLAVIDGTIHWQPYDGAGFAPLHVASAINSDTVDGYHAAEFSLVSHSHSHASLSGLSADDHTQYFKADGTRNLTGQLVSTVTTGTAPLSIASTTKVANLYVDKADKLDLSGTGLSLSSLSDKQYLARDGSNIVGAAYPMPAYLARDNAVGATMDRLGAISTVSPLTVGTLFLTRLWLPGNVVCTSVSFGTGNSAGSGVTNAWAALYDSSLVLRSWTGDKGAFAFSINTSYTWNLNTPSTYTTPASITGAAYFIGIMVAGTGAPNFQGASGGASALGVTPLPCGNSNTSLTTTPPDPATAISSASTTKPWMLIQ